MRQLDLISRATNRKGQLITQTKRPHYPIW